MKLEEAIQQRNFQSEYQKVHINVLYTASWLSQITAAMLKPFHLTSQQFNILRILRGQYPKPASVKLLTERMLDKMSNASRLVDKLLAKQLVERTVNSDDRRQVDVVITQAGLQLLEQIDIHIVRLTNEKLTSLSENEAIILNELLDKLRSEA